MEQLQYLCTKDLTRYADSDGANDWADDNRYTEQYTVVGTCTLAGVETLKTCQQTVMSATHPSIRIYDKSAADFYNDYAPVQLTSLQATHVTDSKWRVTCVFQW
jgi:hypothetical protein